MTDAAGRYAMPLLPIGSYTVTATMTGFQTQERSKIVLEVQASLTLDFVLELSPLTDARSRSPARPRWCNCNAAMRPSAS